MTSLLDYLPEIRNRLVDRTNGWTGVDIGCHEIRWAQVQQVNGGWQMFNAWTLSQTCPKNDQIAEGKEREPFAWTSAAILSEEGFKGREKELVQLRQAFNGHNCAVSLNDGLMGYREVEVPRASEEEMFSMAHSELLLEADSQGADLISQSWEIKSSGRQASGQAVLATVSLPASTSSRIAEDLLRSGWECRIIDAVPCALARACVMATGDPSMPTLALELGYAHSTLMMVLDGQPAMMRCLAKFGMKELITQIASAFSISLADAKTLLSHQKSRATACNDEIGSTNRPLDPFLQAFTLGLSRELERTIRFVESVDQDYIPEKILMSGAGTETDAISTMLSKLTASNVERWQIPTCEHFSKSDCISKYAVAAGLSALRWEAG